MKSIPSCGVVRYETTIHSLPHLVSRKGDDGLDNEIVAAAVLFSVRRVAAPVAVVCAGRQVTHLVVEEP